LLPELHEHHPAASRALTLALTALTAFALHRVLASYADGVPWTRATPDEWITTAALSYAAAVGIILHVGIGLRWPFALKTGHVPQLRQRCCPDRVS
jgi:hypothetical protein